jgi:diadenylate cyclase
VSASFGQDDISAPGQAAMMTSFHDLLHLIASAHYADYIRVMRVGADILIVAYFVYHLMMLAKPTRAWQIFLGLLFLVFVLSFSQYLKLETLSWLLGKMLYLGPVAIVILFFPELRHALEEVGRFGFLSGSFVGLTNKDVSDLVSEIVRAASVLSNRRTGALIVIERETGLADIIDTGTPLNAEVTAELLGTIFHPGSPLHDGAAIVRRGRIAAAGCTLPLTDSPNIGSNIHTRHKAAIGISEQSDAVVVVVSEETGIISFAMQGNLTRHLRDAALEQKLTQVLQGKERPALPRPFVAGRGFRLPPSGRPRGTVDGAVSGPSAASVSNAGTTKSKK